MRSLADLAPAARIALSLAATAACPGAHRDAATPVAPPHTSPPDGSILLGPLSREGCFHVSSETDRRYHFRINDVVYPEALGAGHVAIYVNSGGLIDLAPHPVVLARDPQLDFAAEGDASGPFELMLLLVDSEGRESEPTVMNQICPEPPGKR